MPEFRINEPIEKIEFYAHSGECPHCQGIVKMPRHSETLELLPDKCWCLLCGQKFYVDVGDDLWKWELDQWKQKHPEP